MKRAWRFLTQPVVSVADAMLMASCVIAADALHLGLHLPWGWVLVIVWGITIAAVFLTGFVKGFARSVATDVRKWRAGRERPLMHLLAVSGYAGSRYRRQVQREVCGSYAIPGYPEA